MSELTNFEKQLAENWENAEQVIYDNEQRIAALEAELAAANARANTLADLLRECGDFIAHTDLFEEVDAALAAHQQAQR